VFAQLGDRRARAGLAALLDRRIAAPSALSRYLSTGPRDLTAVGAARRGAAALLDVFQGMRGGLDRFLETGPLEQPFLLFTRQLEAVATALNDDAPLEPAFVHAAFARAREHFLTQDGQPRTKLLLQHYNKDAFASATDWQLHRDLVFGHAKAIVDAYASYRRDLNVIVSRGVWRMFRVAESEYRRTLDAYAVLDFSDLLLRARELLGQMEEFAQSRYRLEARYHHVLVDEFQDTSRAQWDLITLLTRSWGEGTGLAHSGALQPSIFIVGDRKQSIYAFRDADVSILREAGRHLEMLRPDGDVRRSISRSFRAVPSLLAFVNDLCQDMEKVATRGDAFQYSEEDRFPLEGADTAAAAPSGSVALLVADTPEACAETTAAEITRLVADGTLVRDRSSGISRPIQPGDVAILFRTRESHREFEQALERRGLPSYVYKGLGFFDADEIKDVLALLWYLADPASNLRAAAWLRSRFVQISDEGLRQIAPHVAAALSSSEPPGALARLDAEDVDRLVAARASSSRWRALVDRLPPAELLDVILEESAYAAEMRGPRLSQARENVKKIRAIIRRIQNRGYATLDRIASHLDRLAVGDDANAAIDASNAVSLMTVHAAKGLEFPVVFLVNLARGTGNRRLPIRIATTFAGEDASVAVGDFQSAGDEDQAAKEREETKRLLYVAVTRARDRLYLGSVLKDGCLQPGRGSLADVLPPSVIDLFAAALVGGDHVSWRASSGATHSIRVCQLVADDALPVTPSAPSKSQSASHFAVLAVEGGRTRRVSELGATDTSSTSFQAGEASDRLVGTLVHRLLQREGLTHDAPDEWIRQRLLALLRPDESIAVVDRQVLVERAWRAYRAFCAHADLRAIYMAGEAFHEVPFSVAVNGQVVRGNIDCLVRAGTRVTVVEFKTGQPRAEHQAQADLYRLAAQSLFPGAEVGARLIYSGETTLS
jgi:ATP-dependent helicase/nuclease subunit A